MGLGMFIGSMLPPILWGVAIANFMVGVPIDESKNVVGGFLQLLHPFALLGGVMFPTMYCSRITISYDTYNW